MEQIVKEMRELEWKHDEWKGKEIMEKQHWKRKDKNQRSGKAYSAEDSLNNALLHTRDGECVASSNGMTVGNTRFKIAIAIYNCCVIYTCSSMSVLKPSSKQHIISSEHRSNIILLSL